MSYKISKEEIVAMSIAHAIYRSKGLDHLDSLSILMEFREWIFDDPDEDEIFTIYNSQLE